MIRSMMGTLIRMLLVLAGVIGGLFCFFVCERMYAGYPQYYTNVLSWIAIGLIVLAGGAAWIIDERRLPSDD
jgi:hypothetical protein